MKKSKAEPIKIETVVNPQQALTLEARAAEAVGAYIDYMRDEKNLLVSRQRAMNALIIGGWQSIAHAAELAREREATK
jgi:hypothetical protein